MLGDYWLTKELANDRQTVLLHEKANSQQIKRAEKISILSVATVGLLFALNLVF